MARGLRHKGAKKNRAAKRVKYGKKELEKLKGLVKKREVREAIMETIENAENPLCKKVDLIKKIQFDKSKELPKSDFNPDTLKNKHGNFAPWLNLRQVTKLKNNLKKKRQDKNHQNKRNTLNSKRKKRALNKMLKAAKVNGVAKVNKKSTKKVVKKSIANEDTNKPVVAVN